MYHLFLAVHHMDKDRVVGAISQGVPKLAVFCQTKRLCDKVARSLVDLGVDAAAIHGDLPQVSRERALRKFADGRLAVLVATDVAARGLDIDDIGAVVHYDPPKDAKDYLHRSGRTARAGRDGWAVTMVEYNQHTQMRILQRTLRLPIAPPIEVFSNDVRLRDLATFEHEHELDDRSVGTVGWGAAGRCSDGPDVGPSSLRCCRRGDRVRRRRRLDRRHARPARRHCRRDDARRDDRPGDPSAVPATTVDPATAGTGFVSIQVRLPASGVDETLALDRATVSADALDPVSLDAYVHAARRRRREMAREGRRPAPPRRRQPADLRGVERGRRDGRR